MLNKGYMFCIVLMSYIVTSKNLLVEIEDTNLGDEARDYSFQDPCSLPIVEGDRCRAYIPSYGYENGHCREFSYTGCDGNANNFDSMDECEKTCGDPCSMPIDEGNCRQWGEAYGFEGNQIIFKWFSQKNR